MALHLACGKELVDEVNVNENNNGLEFEVSRASHHSNLEENEESFLKRENDGIIVPPLGALLLCSFFATQQYVPGTID